MDAYTGGIPPLYSRRQRGGGFFSALKRFLVPIARTALPHVVGAVGDVLGGQSIGDTLKSRGRSAGVDVLHKVADTMSSNNAATAAPPPPPPKKYKRKAPPPKRTTTNKRAKRTGGWT